MLCCGLAEDEAFLSMKALKVCLSQMFVHAIQLLAPQSNPHIRLGLVVALETRIFGFL